jgi:S1-C subfamily serine protease
MKRTLLAAVAAILVALQLPALDLTTSLVTIKVTTQSPDHYSPWRKRAPSQQEVQGCVLEGSVILTIAPPLADQVLVEVSKLGSPRKYTATVLLTDYVAGLALLTVRDPGFFADLAPLALAEPGALPEKLTIARWEAGGILREFSASAVKTAVDYFTPLGATLAHFLSTDMDRGGSGEALLAAGRLVGLAYYLDPSSKNLKVHAVEVLRRLFADLADGSYGGYPSAWEFTEGLEGDGSLKRYLGLDEGEAGVLVTAVPPRMSGAGILLPGDVILAVDGRTIDDSGLYRSESFGMLHYESLLFLSHQVGDTVAVRVLRDKRRVELAVRLLPIDREAFLIPIASADEVPEYVVFGGLVFQELTRGYLQGAWGGDWWQSADARLLYLTQDRSLFPEPDRRRIVVLNRVLPHAVNAGYQSESSLVLERLNGVAVRDLAHLSALLRAAGARYAVFEFMGGDRLVLSFERAAAAEKEIQSAYGLQASSYVRTPGGD